MSVFDNTLSRFAQRQRYNNYYAS